MASDASSTGATLQTLAPVVIWGFAGMIILSIAVPSLLGVLHRKANPEMRTGEEGIWMLKVQMLLLGAPWSVVSGTKRSWQYMREHRWAWSRYKGRHRAA